MKKKFLILFVFLSFFMIVSCEKHQKCENGHTWHETEIIKEATCSENGLKKYVCDVCGQTKEEPTDKLNHQFGTQLVKGETSHYYLCEICQNAKKDEAFHEYDHETNTCICGKFNTQECYLVSFNPLPEDTKVSIYLTNTFTDMVTYSIENSAYTNTSDGTYDQEKPQELNFMVECPSGYEVKMTIIGEYESVNKIKEQAYQIKGITTDLTITIEIEKTKIKLTKPTENIYQYAYTKEEITFLPNDFLSSFMTIENNVQTEIGTYTVIVKIINKELYAWEDGTTDDLIFNYEIIDSKIKVANPSELEQVFIYNKEEQVYYPNGFNQNLMQITNNHQTNVGTYQVKVTLKDEENYYFEGNITEFVFDFVILPCEIAKPTVSNVEYQYTGKTLNYIPSGYMEDIMNITGDKASNVGKYQVKVTLKDDLNYCWNDGKNEVITIEWEIVKQKVTKPIALNNQCTYTNNLITFIPTYFKEDIMNITGHQQTEIGEYDVTISLKDLDNYEWEDGTINDIILSFSIVEVVLPYQIVLDNQQLIITHQYDDETFVAKFVIPENINYEINQDNGLLTFMYELVNTEAILFTLSGQYYGGIKFVINEETDLEIELNNFTIISDELVAIDITSANNCDLSAKKGTINYLYDYRDAVEENKYVLFCDCDLKLKGAGTLEVYSKNNNGIHTKDDLKVQKLTLKVNAVDNALKGNDSVTINSGELTLIARQGDGIKTSNSELSSKGKQKGTVTINEGIINIYAACDGIDACFDVVINDGILNIYTDKYSEYSEAVTKVQDSVYYIRANTTSYKYSIYYYNDINNGEWVNSTSYSSKNMGFETYYYYEIPKLSSYASLIVYVYSNSQSQGQAQSYYKVSSTMSLNNNYDTIAFSTRNRPGESSGFSWTSSTSQDTRPGGMGPGGMDEGNTNKGDYSTKGIKADNEISILGGTIYIEAYDDAIHTNNDNTIESGVTPTGNITISGGTLTLSSCDDGIHADGALNISDGNITVVTSYEGLEGQTIHISGGNIKIEASDDGINACCTSGIGIKISGGNLYINAGGDGLDSNSQTSYQGIVFTGGQTVVISTGRADSSIDTERGYSYTGGYVVGIGMSGGMSSESKNCSNFNSIGKSTTISLTKNNYLTISGIVTIKMPVSMSAFVVVLGSTTSSISQATSSSLTFDDWGLCWQN